jgi:hypothetical protein
LGRAIGLSVAPLWPDMSSFLSKTITRKKTNFIPWSRRYIASAMEVGYLGRCKKYVKRLCSMQCWSEYSLKKLCETARPIGLSGWYDPLCRTS